MKVDKYEKAWIIFSCLAVIMFLGITGINAASKGFLPPSHASVVDSAYLPADTFGNPRVIEVVKGEKYEVYMVAKMFSFTPSPVSVPSGAEVTFHITSPDVTHGVEIIGSNVNVMVLPGYVSTVTTTFDKPGEYAIICHEYCGQLHHAMKGKLIVEGSAR